LNGQGVTITETPRPLPECFWKEAYAAGAVSGDMVGTTLEDKLEAKRLELEVEAKIKRDKLKEVLKEIKENPVENTDKHGFPLVRKVSAFYGEPVKKEDYKDIWEDLISED